MKVNVRVNFPEDIEMWKKRAADLLSLMLIKKLESKEIDELIDILKDNSNKIN